jgi:phosphopantothenoylcysteine synthetase/decarboxylase
LDHILALSGSPKEIIDGVRYYANQMRPEHLGMHVAERLKEKGFKVTVLAPDESIVSAHDLIKAATKYSGQADIKAVLQLANISSIRPAKPSAHKLKVKKERSHGVPMEVAGNVDTWARLEPAFPEIPIISYEHKRLVSTLETPLTKELFPIIERTRTEVRRKSPTPTNSKAHGNPLAKRKVIVTSGPTAEQLTTGGDVITNFSSGRQGIAIAETLADMGAQVLLISGPTALPDPAHRNIITMHAVDARTMYYMVMQNLPADAYIGVAAIADFGIGNTLDIKLKEDEPYTLHLIQNPDILQIIGTHAALRPKVVIGFAAETDSSALLDYAREKLVRKGADAICANQVGGPGGDTNQVTWVAKDGAQPWEAMDKHAVGHKIGLKLAEMLGSK